MKINKKSLFALAAAGALCMSFMACNPSPEDNNGGNESGDSKKEFPAEPSIPCPEGDGIDVVISDASVMDKGSVVSGPTFSNGEATFTVSAQYSGGGVIFYIKPDQSIVNLPNYDSIYIDFEYETGTWKDGAKAPQWCLNVYGEGAGFWNGGKTLQYFGDGKMYGRTSIIHTISEIDTIVAVGLKLNAYQSGNADNDTCRITLKKIKFLRKAGAGEDKPEDDGLTDEQRGTIKKINYPSKDYENGGTVATTKPAYIYLPAGYDEDDEENSYPVLYLMHGVGGNEAEWGMTGNGSRIKKFMDKEIAAGNVRPFIIVCPNGRSNTNYSNGEFSNSNAFYSFGSELRNDLIKYMEDNYNVKTGRNGRAMAGLSMGGMQTINIGMCETLDLISWFGAFSAAPTSYEKAKVNKIITGEELSKNGKDFTDYEINYFYNICGLQDTTALDSHKAAAKGLDEICPKLTAGKNFTWYETDGVHGFDIWYPGFEAFAKIVFDLVE